MILGILSPLLLLFKIFKCSSHSFYVFALAARLVSPRSIEPDIAAVPAARPPFRPI